MAGSGDDIELLFLGEVDEFDRISGDADGEVRIFRFLWVVHAIDELFFAEDVDVKVMCAAVEIAVKDADKVIDPLLLAMAQAIVIDRLSVGNAVKRVFVWEFG